MGLVADAAQVLSQDIEVMGFAKKRSEIRGQGIGKCLPFVAALALEVVEIVLEAGNAERTQPPRQAAIDHVLLGFGKHDADARIDQLAYPFEVPFGVRILAQIRLGYAHVRRRWPPLMSLLPSELSPGRQLVIGRTGAL